MSERTKRVADVEERFVNVMSSRFDFDSSIAYQFIRQLAAENLVIIDADDLGTYRALVGAFKTINKILPQ